MKINNTASHNTSVKRYSLYYKCQMNAFRAKLTITLKCWSIGVN